MKNLFFLIALVSITLLLGTSCKKEEYRATDSIIRVKWDGTDSVQKVINWMAFRDRDVWMNVLDYLSDRSDEELRAWEDFYAFGSMRAYYCDRDSFDSIPPPMPIFDHMVAALVNYDRLVQIGDKLYLIDPEEEKIYILHEITTTNVSRLMNREVETDLIDCYSTSTAVLYLGEEGGEVFSRSCSEDRADPHSEGAADVETEERTNGNNTKSYRHWKMAMTHYYQNLGLAFTLACNMDYTFKDWNDRSFKKLATYHKYECDYKYKPRCKDEVVVPYLDTYFSSDRSGTQNTRYRSTKQLNKYQLSTTFIWKNKRFSYQPLKSVSSLPTVQDGY